MKERLKKTKCAMEEAGFSALLITKPENQFYLSGLQFTDTWIVITLDNNYILTDFRYIERASELSPLFEIISIDKKNTGINFLLELNPEKPAVEERHISFFLYNELSKNIKNEIQCSEGIIEKIRMIKDENELSSIAKAETLGDECFIHMLEILRPGMTEKEAALEIEVFLRKNGAERLSFDTICVCGKRTALPHGEPTDKVMKKGDFITMDFGCVIDGYCSDMTRTVALGPISSEQKEVYRLVSEAQKAGCDAIKEGLNCKEADRIARSIIEDSGYGKAFGHGTGHGVGLEIHEAPTINPESDDVLKKNMVVTVEPGIYLPGKFGVRIEDLVIVTASGIINLTRSDKDLILL